MEGERIVFYILAGILIFAAMMVVTRPNPVHSVLFLVLAFFTSAGLWLLLEAEFLAIILVLVYVGAVMVLFLFVVMMLDINLTPLREGFARYLPIGSLVAFLIAIQMVLIMGPRYFGLDIYEAPARAPADYSNTAEIGRLLYTVYVYPFEIAAVLLLVAIVGAIVLTMRRRPDSKYQRPGKQVQVKKADRIRLVTMRSERDTPID